jgi:hypothetical protein
MSSHEHFLLNDMIEVLPIIHMIKTKSSSPCDEEHVINMMNFDIYPKCIVPIVNLILTSPDQKEKMKNVINNRLNALRNELYRYRYDKNAVVETERQLIYINSLKKLLCD